MTNDEKWEWYDSAKVSQRSAVARSTGERGVSAIHVSQQGSYSASHASYLRLGLYDSPRGFHALVLMTPRCRNTGMLQHWSVAIDGHPDGVERTSAICKSSTKELLDRCARGS